MEINTFILAKSLFHSYSNNPDDRTCCAKRIPGVQLFEILLHWVLKAPLITANN